MKQLLRSTILMMAGVGLLGCKPSKSESSKPAPPAKVSQIAKEDALASIQLTPEAEQRLGIVTTPASVKPLERRRTFGADLFLALGQPNVPSDSSTNKPRSIYSLFPTMTPSEMIRVAEQQVDADGQVAAGKVQVNAAQIALKRAEGMLAEKAGSIRAVDEAKALVSLAETTLQSARARRELLGAPLFETVQLDVLWARVPVYIGEISNLKTAAPARVGDLASKSNDFTRVATPINVPISAGIGSATIDLFYEVPNKDHLLRLGQRVAVQIPMTGEEDSLVVPASALLYDIHGNTWVYENNTPRGFTRRRVEVRFVSNAEAALARGLSVGAKIVTTGAAELFGAEFGFGK